MFDSAPLALALCLVTAAGDLGCATHYQPRMSPRISVAMSGGMPEYTRDGQVFEHGLAGGGLVDAVAGDPEATEAAETYNNRMIGGLVSDGIALACVGAGIGLTANRASRNEGIDPLAGAAITCGLAGAVVALVLIASAQPYQWDAINLYNDHVDARMMPYWPVRPPPGAVPGAPPGPMFRPPPPAVPHPPATAPPAPAAPMPSAPAPVAPPGPAGSSSGALPDAP
jgi:hypothetical protein